MVNHSASVFRTKLGWTALYLIQNEVSDLVFGYESADAALSALQRRRGIINQLNTTPRSLMRQICDFAAGHVVDLRDVPVYLGKTTRFQRNVIDQCRAIPYGATASYGELAACAGYPRAARAVGSVMSRNRVPLIVPCHRVITAAGKLGNYSGPQGVQTKKKLLAMECRAQLPPSRTNAASTS